MPFRTFRPANALLCAAFVVLAAACGDPSGPGPGPTPPPPSEVTLPVMALGAGEHHVCALTPEGRAYCWGYGVYAANGQGFTGADSCVENMPAGPQTACSLAPRPVGDGSHRFTSLAVGFRTSCGIQADGAVLCWGLTGNVLGTPGPETCWLQVPCNPTPTPAAQGRRWKQLSISGTDRFHVCGVAESGEGFCWGTNSWGRLGNGAMSDAHAEPQPVAGGLRFARISAGGEHSCGLTPQGAAYCWGSNLRGQLGTDQGLSTCTTYSGGKNPVRIDFGCTATPVPVQGARVFTDLQANQDATCGATAAGELYCWGGFDGAGEGTPAQRRVFADVQVRSFTLSQRQASPEDYLCALDANGAAYCWAGTHPTRGEAGDGSVALRGSEPAAAKVVGPDPFTHIALTGWSACGITAAGGVNCWGRNMYGVLGRPDPGQNDGSAVPRPVSRPTT
jgi:alpha-tubulin suppressor-like RCC1 family protein